MTCLFQQILIYYDNRWRLLLKHFISWILTLDRLRLQCGLFQGCWAVVKLIQLRLLSSCFMNMAPAPELFFKYFKLVFFTSSALTMRKSAKKQQSRVETIQRTATTRNITQNNGNINNFWKGFAGFGVNAWGPVVISYDQNQVNSCLEN